MGLLAFFFRALLFLVIFRLASIVLRAFFGGFFQGARSSSPVTRRDGFPPGVTPGGGQIEELVKDPVCGVHTARSSAIAGRYQGREAYFCSEECAAKAV